MSGEPQVSGGGHPAGRGHPARALGILHPFPSVLVALVVGVLAALAGGTVQVVLVLAIAMFAFQVSIGAVNDLADLEHDRAIGAPKPLPAGQVSVQVARAVAVAGGAIGCTLSAFVGLDVLLVGVVGYACGIGYDLWLRTRGLAWVAYAAAIPLLLVYAWLGGAGTLPPSWPLLLPAAAAIGPALHLSNSFVDVDTDAADPAGGLAGRLGRRRGLLAMTGLLALVYGLAWAIVATGTGKSTGEEVGTSSRSILGPAGMLVATVIAIIGVGLSAGGSRRTRAMGWGFQATATALLGVSLLASIRP